MSLINNKNFLYEEEDNLPEYKLPRLVVTKPEVISVKKSASASVGLHILLPTLVWVITIALALLGIKLFTFNKPDAKLKKDIEFVLVDKEAMPRNPKTKNRADMNSRSGGINDPTRKVSMPSPAPAKKSKPSAAATSANKIIKKQQQAAQQKAQQKAKQQQQQQQNQTKTTQQSAVNKPSPAKPAPPTARPSVNPVSAPAPVNKPSTAFNIPRPANAPTGKTLATGPIGGTSAPTGVGKGGSGSSGGSSNGAPRPSLAPSASSGTGSLGRTGSGGGTGNVGNPGGGGGAPGIDALREPDFGPYMRELQRRIKMNWDPPKGNESKRVVLLFKIAKDGRLLTCRVSKSSGLPSADQAALKAVELTAPFRPLPADFKGQSIDIQFTFDYNVFNVREFPTFKTYKTEEISRWIIGRGKVKGVSFKEDAIELMVEQIGNNLRQFDNEIDKLKLMAYPEKVVTRSMVEDICISNQDLFNFAELIMIGKKDKALLEFKKLLDKKHPLELLSAIQTMLRKWIIIKTKSASTSAFELSKITGMHEFVVKQTIQKLKKTSAADLVRLKENLFEVEYKIKSAESVDMISEVECAIIR